MKPLKKGATYDDLRDVPGALRRRDVRRRALRVAAARAAARARGFAARRRARRAVRPRRNGPGGWVILDEPELHFGNDVLVPDIAGWRRERLPNVPADAYLTLAPDWICEVLSPSTETLDRGKKLRIYAREACRRTPGSWIRCGKRSKCCRSSPASGLRWRCTRAASRCVRAPFDAIELELGALWC